MCDRSLSEMKRAQPQRDTGEGKGEGWKESGSRYDMNGIVGIEWVCECCLFNVCVRQRFVWWLFESMESGTLEIKSNKLYWSHTNILQMLLRV